MSHKTFTYRFSLRSDSDPPTPNYSSVGESGLFVCRVSNSLNFADGTTMESLNVHCVSCKLVDVEA